ncbi:hypothetical protein LADH09A_002638 [Micromonospora sp. LAH09]|uniref:hypothetical protein n=1 Tax=Micromonospora cabrerizensis TaxID=2911213 RepID=UPI001EE81CD4|nr:hypothetical protein [Micromonospora cabrerizensis]MCG5467299.1 hypothetical protein [Micromonospora cabrerizensis]
MDTSPTPAPDTTPLGTPRPDVTAAGRPSTPRVGRPGSGRHRTGPGTAPEITRSTDTGAGSTTGRPTDARRTTTGRTTDAPRRATTDGDTDTAGPATNRKATTARRATTPRDADAPEPTAGHRKTDSPRRGSTSRGTDAAAGASRPGKARPVDTGPPAAHRTAPGRGPEKNQTTTGHGPTESRTATGRRPGTTTTRREAAAEPPAGTAADTTGPAPASRRRRTLLLVLALTAATSATALVLGLLSWAPDPPEPTRPLTLAEGERLAAARVTNLRDLRAGVRITAGADAARIELVGWVDWSRSLLYLDVGGPGASTERGLVQRVGPILVIRPDPAAVPTPAAPPLLPPADRWRLHRLAPGTPLGPVLDLLLGLATDRPDQTQAVPGSGARWIARDTVAAGPVDVLQASLPAGPPQRTPAPGSTGAPTPGAGSASTDPDGQTRFWLDQDARLHKLVTRLPGVGPVTMILNRADRPTLRPVDALGGRPGLPRTLTDAERRRLDRLPARLRAQRGATMTLTAPVGTDTNLRGTGWVSWTTRSAYLAVADLGVPDRRTLLRRDTAGLTRADLPADAAGGGTAEVPGRPPLPPPAGPWRAQRSGGDDLTMLVDAAVAAGSVGPSGTAVRVREDVTAGRTVDVVEVGPAGARLRYWIDRDGSLRRLELHTDANAWAQLDLQPAVVPRLNPVPRPAAKPRPAAPRPR